MLGPFGSVSILTDNRMSFLGEVVSFTVLYFSLDFLVTTSNGLTCLWGSWVIPAPPAGISATGGTDCHRRSQMAMWKGGKEERKEVQREGGGKANSPFATC